MWAVLRLQVIPENLGGAGRNRIEWEFDDAVLKEAAGKDFMLEAVEVLKGVLAFEEQPSSKYFGASYGQQKFSGLTPTHSRSQSQPLTSDSKQPPSVSGNQTKGARTRAPSDPFLDTPTTTLSRSAATTSSHLSSAATAVGLPLQFETTEENEAEGEYMRVWTSPDLTVPEILQLLNLFPSFVSRRALPRFEVSATLRPTDIEEGYDSSERQRIRFGTGSMWVSSKQRSDGWEGSWWTRIVLWLKRLFC